MNGLSNSGCASTESDVSVSFNASKEVFFDSDQLKFVSFRVNKVRGLFKAEIFE